jgi:hypothetical protein
MLDAYSHVLCIKHQVSRITDGHPPLWYSYNTWGIQKWEFRAIETGCAIAYPCNQKGAALRKYIIRLATLSHPGKVLLSLLFPRTSSLRQPAARGQRLLLLTKALGRSFERTSGRVLLLDTEIVLRITIRSKTQNVKRKAVSPRRLRFTHYVLQVQRMPIIISNNPLARSPLAPACDRQQHHGA